MESIINLWTDHRRRVLAWFQDDVFRRLFVNAGKLVSANAVAAVLGLVAAVLTARAFGSLSSSASLSILPVRSSGRPLRWPLPVP